MLAEHNAWLYVTRKPFMSWQIIYHNIKSHCRKEIVLNKEIAQQLFSRIPDGHTNPLQRHPSAHVDRVFRRMVEDANKSGDCIINVGRGYYRPLPGDAVDEKEFNEYMKKELSRAREIQLKRLKMRDAFRKREEVEVFTDHTRKTG